MSAKAVVRSGVAARAAHGSTLPTVAPESHHADSQAPSTSKFVGLADQYDTDPLSVVSVAKTEGVKHGHHLKSGTAMKAKEHKRHVAAPPQSSANTRFDSAQTLDEAAPSAHRTSAPAPATAIKQSEQSKDRSGRYRHSDDAESKPPNRVQGREKLASDDSSDELAHNSGSKRCARKIQKQAKLKASEQHSFKKA